MIEHLLEQNLPKSINRTTIMYPSPPGVEGARIDSRATPARGSPPKRVTRNCSKRLPCLSSPKPRYQRTSHTRARLGAELQQLYAEGIFAEIGALVDACLPKDAAGNFIAEQEKSDVVHDLLAFLAEKMLEMNKPKQKEIKDFLSWLESYLGAKVEDLTPKTKLNRTTTSTIMRASWRCSRRTERSWLSIPSAGSLRRRYGPSSRVQSAS